jgi:hypothetical protein
MKQPQQLDPSLVGKILRYVVCDTNLNSNLSQFSLPL